ncbi:MAG: hypothetical protein ACOC2U_01055 [bacterium]
METLRNKLIDNGFISYDKYEDEIGDGFTSYHLHNKNGVYIFEFLQNENLKMTVKNLSYLMYREVTWYEFTDDNYSDIIRIVFIADEKRNDLDIRFLVVNKK